MGRPRQPKVGDFVFVTWDDITEISGWSLKGQKHTPKRFESAGWIAKLPEDDTDTLDIVGDREIVENGIGDDEGRKQLIISGAIRGIRFK